MTLAIHLVWSAVRRGGVSRVLQMIIAVFLELLHAAGWSLVLPRHLSTGLIADRGQLDGATCLLIAGRRRTFGRLAVGRDRGSSSAILLGFALVLLLLLASLPLLADLLEFCEAKC